MTIHIVDKSIVVAIVLLTFATTCSFAEVSGSAHDFASGGIGTEICIFCHTPHNADQTILEAPLWNHELSAETNYTLYDSETMNQAPPDEPLGISKLCLSCHDGTVAIDSFGNQTGTQKILPGEPAYIGTDLSDDHPISILWGLQHRTIFSGSGPVHCGKCHDNIGEGPEKLPLPFYTYGGGRGSARLECSTCHDPHNNGANEKLLRKPNDNSELCFWCHNK